MKKLLLSILGLLLLTSVTIAEESDIQKYNFYWDQVPVVCGAPEEIDRWANDKGFTPLSLSYGKEGGDKDGSIRPARPSTSEIMWSIVPLQP